MASNRRRTRSVASHSSVETVDNLKAGIVHLQQELEAERKCIRQLRREKAYEVQLAREQEQNKAAISLKELAAKLQQEKEQELETLRFRCKADIVKVVKQKDKEVNKIKKDLGKCQDDLKEEVFKYGLSTSARATFELERLKLLQEIKELSASKKQIEDALHAAIEAEKQRAHELRQLQETSRNELAKLNKQANIEVKRLLEQLKAKDQLIPTTKRSCPAAATAAASASTTARSASAKCQPETCRSSNVGELVGLSKEIESWTKKLSVIDEVADLVKSGGSLPNFSLQRKLYDIEKQLKLIISASDGFAERNSELKNIILALEQKIVVLAERNSALNLEVKFVKDEAKQLKELMFSNASAHQDDLHRQLSSYSSLIKPSTEKKSKKKKVPTATLR